MLGIVLFTVFIRICTKCVEAGGPHYCESGGNWPCQNGGTCKGGGNTYTCECAEGFRDRNCDKIDCTSKIYCLNGGTCNLTNSGYNHLCKCAYGWTGDNCEIIDVCTPYTNADIVFLVDVSESEGNETFKKQRDYIRNFVSKFPIGPLDYRYQFSVVTYSFDPTIHFYLNNYTSSNDLDSAIASITQENQGPSFTGKGLLAVLDEVLDSKNGARSSVEHYVVVITDGLSSDPTDTVSQAHSLMLNRVKIYSVAIGAYVNYEELIDISLYPERVFTMVTNDSLECLLKYTMYGCSNCTDMVSDVAILMDVSSNIDAKNFNLQIQAAAHVIKIAQVGQDAVQFSYTTFSEQYNNVYNFDTYAITSDLVSKIYSDTHLLPNSYSNISNVLEHMYNDGFSAIRGTRSNARKIIVLISTGNDVDTTQAFAKSQHLKDNGYFVVSIGVGMAANVTNLLQLASDPALTFILGDEIYQNITVLNSLKTFFEYSFCSHL